MQKSIIIVASARENGKIKEMLPSDSMSKIIQKNHTHIHTRSMPRMKYNYEPSECKLENIRTVVSGTEHYQCSLIKITNSRNCMTSIIRQNFSKYKSGTSFPSISKLLQERARARQTEWGGSFPSQTPTRGVSHIQWRPCDTPLLARKQSYLKDSFYAFSIIHLHKYTSSL